MRRPPWGATNFSWLRHAGRWVTPQRRVTQTHADHGYQNTVAERGNGILKE